MESAELEARIAEVSKTIYSYCRAKTSTREEAEDLSQDILLNLIRSVGSLRDERAFYAFMWGVAGNVYKQWCGKKQRHSCCELTEEILSALPSEQPPELLLSGESDDIYLLRRELTLLSERYRRATVLYYIEGRSCAEISELLAVSESTVKYLLFKSRKVLKEGMSMQRDLGKLSYDPKTLIPLYSGEGPNRFADFMQSRIRQNILSACYNDSLTAQQISLETGIPLPYLDDEIAQMESRGMLVRDGRHYKANVIVITAECQDEIDRAAVGYHEQIADMVERFLSEKIDDFISIGFVGSDFSENTLRWQLAAVLFRAIAFADPSGGDAPTPPRTAWGESAYLWCIEKPLDADKYIFSYSSVRSRHGDELYFFDYKRGGKGNHRDFYGNERYVSIFCDICSGRNAQLGEYDLEAVAEMIRKGYAVKDGDGFAATVPVYTHEQYARVSALAAGFVCDGLQWIIRDMNSSAERILGAYTPRHLQGQVAGIAAMDKFVNAVCMPASILIDRRVLSTAWHPLEMPTTYMVSDG